MALISLNSNVTRLTQRITENFKESTRDISLIHGGAGSSAQYFEAGDDKLKEIGKLLDGRGEMERLEGMKRLIAMISKGRDMSSFFPQVVKNVATPSIEIRKLIYIYLLRYASAFPDLLLLSINTFQKDLSDPSPLIRSMSLRVLTSIRLPMIQGLVMIGLNKLSGDRNPWVRKSVAGGLSKVYDMDTTTLPLLLPLLTKLLSSPSPLTLGSTLSTFSLICPDNLSLLHPHFRKLCLLLVDADEWGQIVALGVLERYAREFLERPKGAGGERLVDGEGVKTDEQKRQDGLEETTETEDQDQDLDSDLDQDLHLLLHCVHPLFQSRNPAVILSASKLFFALAPNIAPEGSEEILQKEFVGPLLRLITVRGGRGEGGGQVGSVVMDVVKEMAQERPWLFEHHHTRFFPYYTDSIQLTLSKLQILQPLISSSNVTFLLSQFKEYVRHPNREIMRMAITAIGECARLEEGRGKGLGVLMGLLTSTRESAVGQAVIILKSLIQLSSSVSSSGNQDNNHTSSDLPRRLTSKLVKQLNGITHSSARACVFWLAGQYVEIADGNGERGMGEYQVLEKWGPDALRIGVKGFMDEASQTKLQILTFAAKLLVICPTAKPFNLLAQYLFTLARYDADWDVRDRGRFLHSLLRGVRRKQSDQESLQEDGRTVTEDRVEEEDLGGVVLRREQVKLVLLGPRDPTDSDESKGSYSSSSGLNIGSLSALAGRKIQGYESLPDWPEEPTDSSLRDVEADYIPQSNSTMTPAYSRSSSFQPPVLSLDPNTPQNSASPASSYAAPRQKPKETVQKPKFKDLDDFLNESTEEEDEESSDDEEEEQVASIKPAATGLANTREIDEDSSSKEETSDEEESDE